MSGELEQYEEVDALHEVVGKSFDKMLARLEKLEAIREKRWNTMMDAIERIARISKMHPESEENDES